MKNKWTKNIFKAWASKHKVTHTQSSYCKWMITDNSFDVLCLTETWLKTNDYFGLNESTPPSYCYKHEPRQTGRGGGVAIIYSDILNVTQKTGYRFN